MPVDGKWSLQERPGYLRLHALPATSFWHARNSLTQRGIGPESYATVELDVSGLQAGDKAGLALLNLPYAWIGVLQEDAGRLLQFYDQQTGEEVRIEVAGDYVWLRAHCDFQTDEAKLGYSFDGEDFHELGDKVVLPYQLRTFQGVRYALFCFNTDGGEGGYADFDSFEVQEPRPHGLTRPIPYGEIVTIRSLGDGTILTNWKNYLRPVNENSPFAAGEKHSFPGVGSWPGSRCAAIGDYRRPGMRQRCGRHG